MKKFKKFGAFGLFIVMALSMVACSSGNPVIGKWKDVYTISVLESAGIDLSGNEIILDFKDDGTVERTSITADGEKKSTDTKYTIEGDKVTLTADGDSLVLTLDGNTMKNEAGEVMLEKQ